MGKCADAPSALVAVTENVRFAPCASPVAVYEMTVGPSAADSQMPAWSQIVTVYSEIWAPLGAAAPQSRVMEVLPLTVTMPTVGAVGLDEVVVTAGVVTAEAGEGKEEPCVLEEKRRTV